MKNITVSLKDEAYRRARIAAAERSTSVSALVREFLDSLTAGETQFERLKRQEIEVRERIEQFRAGDRLSREDVHKRTGLD